MILAMNFSLNIQANKKVDFGTISIKADQITFNDAMEKLSLNNNIEISFDKYVITGNTGILSYKSEQLEIAGMPASINSDEIDGTANLFIIYPNKSLEMIGNAKLNNKGNNVTSNLITYQMSADK
mgnify:FL=1